MKKKILIGLSVVVILLIALITYGYYYHSTHLGAQPAAVPTNPVLTGNSITSNSDSNTTMTVDVLESLGIVRQSKYYLDVLGPAKLHFVFTKTNANGNCVFGYGDNTGVGYDAPLVGKFEATVDAPANSSGDYYVVCKNADGSLGKYLRLAVFVYDPKFYPSSTPGVSIPFINLPGSNIRDL